MGVAFNTNIKLLAGGSFCGDTSWNKKTTSIDNCFKFYALRKGRIRIDSGRSSKELDSNHFYFVNGYKMDSQVCLDHFVVDWIHFLPQSLYFNHILKQTPVVMPLPVDDFVSFASVQKKFKSLFGSKMNEDEKRIVQLEIQAFIYFLISKVYPQVIANHSGSDEIDRLKPALDFIAENYKNPVSLKDIADQCCLSSTYFHRLFSAYLKLTPANYIQNLRMDEAVRQLAYTSQAVKTIAFNVGYDDEAYFSRVFSKVYGVSPGKYRKGLNQHIP